MIQVQKRLNQEGFTLIEILLATAILAFGLLAIATMQIIALKTTGRADRLTTEATAAMSQMESIINITYSDLPAQGNTEIVGDYSIEYIKVTDHPNNSTSARSATITARLTPVNDLFDDKATDFTFIKTWFSTSEDTYSP